MKPELTINTLEELDTTNPNCVRGLPKDLCTGCEQCAILDAIE